MHVPPYSVVIHIFKIKLIGNRPSFTYNNGHSVKNCDIKQMNVLDLKTKFVCNSLYQKSSDDQTKGI